MPEICRFSGMIITMNFDDHVPPHFHVRYGKRIISVTISDGTITGKLPKKKQAEIDKWRKVHKKELEANWLLAKSSQETFKIPAMR